MWSMTHYLKRPWKFVCDLLMTMLRRRAWRHTFIRHDTSVTRPGSVGSFLQGIVRSSVHRNSLLTLLFFQASVEILQWCGHAFRHLWQATFVFVFFGFLLLSRLSSILLSRPPTRGIRAATWNKTAAGKLVAFYSDELFHPLEPSSKIKKKLPLFPFRKFRKTNSTTGKYCLE